MKKDKRKKFVFSIGGSNISATGELNTEFLEELNQFIREHLKSHPQDQFFLVIGGGAAAKNYRDAGRDVVGHELKLDDLDWLGIHATRLNAHLIRTIFHDIAHKTIIDDYNIIRKAQESVIVAAGWKPGWSTDYCATLLCEDYHITTIINLSNVPQVYDKDPQRFQNAKPVSHMNWKKFREVAGDDWIPGIHMPFDPVAAKKAEELHVRVIIMSNDFQNIQNYFSGKKFVGTVIE